MLVITRPGNNLHRSWIAQLLKPEDLGRKVASSNHCAGNIFNCEISIQDCSATRASEFALYKCEMYIIEIVSMFCGSIPQIE